MSQRTIVGCMTGTSMDAIDAALVSVEGTGMQMRASVQRCATQPLGSLAGPLWQLAFMEPMSAGRIAKLARELALRHVTASAGPPVNWPRSTFGPLVNGHHQDDRSRTVDTTS